MFRTAVFVLLFACVTASMWPPPLSDLAQRRGRGAQVKPLSSIYNPILAHALGGSQHFPIPPQVLLPGTLLPLLITQLQHVLSARGHTWANTFGAIPPQHGYNLSIQAAEGLIQLDAYPVQVCRYGAFQHFPIPPQVLLPGTLLPLLITQLQHVLSARGHTWANTFGAIPPQHGYNLSIQAAEGLIQLDAYPVQILKEYAASLSAHAKACIVGSADATAWQQYDAQLRHNDTWVRQLAVPPAHGPPASPPPRSPAITRRRLDNHLESPHHHMSPLYGGRPRRAAAARARHLINTVVDDDSQRDPTTNTPTRPQHVRVQLRGTAAERAASRAEQDAVATSVAAAELRRAGAASRATRNRARSRNNTHNSARAAIGDPLPVTRHDIGKMDVKCPFCGALHWMGEKVSGSSQLNPQFSECCSRGKVRLPHFSQPPPYMKELLTGNSSDAIHFRKDKQRMYNSGFQMASSSANWQQLPGTGPQQFRISGNIHHLTGPLLPTGDQRPQFAQLYIIDESMATEERSGLLGGGMRTSILNGLSAMMHQFNPFVRLFRQAAQLLQRPAQPLPPTPSSAAAVAPESPVDVHVVIHADGAPDRRRYNAQVVPELAGFMPDGESVSNRRDVVLSCVGGGCVKRIDELNPAYDPLHYPLMFPHGDKGWQLRIPLKEPQLLADAADVEGQGAEDEDEPMPDPLDESDEDMLRDMGGEPPPGDDDGEGVEQRAGRKKQRYVTAMQFAAYHMFDLWQRCNYTLYYGRLFQEWTVDQYAKVEGGRLDWMRHHQKDIRAELYQGVADSVARGDNDPNAVGKRIVLASSFIGGPRHMHQLYQDAMGIVRKHGKPDLFITMTCNPKWKEIQDALKPNQTANDRSDIISRVFKLKLDSVLDDLHKKHVLGKTGASMYTIEFQKRGLPHAHILIILAEEDKLRSPDDYDRVICAELPDPEAEPELYETITCSMMHGPCGELNPAAPCCRNDTKTCEKRYPKTFNETTQDAKDGYPLYRRRNDGRVVNKKVGDLTIQLDNRHVVPYNPWLCKKYNCHINVEYCASIRSVKYLHKYVFKGHDRAQVELRTAPGAAGDGPEDVDEIKQYTDGRYVGASEAAWRLFGFSMHHNLPKVVRLDIHLPDQETLYFDRNANLADVANSRTRTKLTAWMEYNREHPGGRHLVYPDVCSAFTWHDNGKVWKPRLTKVAPPIGRMYYVPPREGARFYLRLLLHHVPGATSWADLRTADGRCFATFKEAAVHRGLLQDDSEWLACMQEAISFKMPSALREMFAQLLEFCHLADPLALWEAVKEELAADILHDARRAAADMELPLSQHMLDEALRRIQDALAVHGHTLADFPDMPIPPAAPLIAAELSRAFQEQLQYDHEQLHEQVQSDRPKLNTEQATVFDAVIEAVAHVKARRTPVLAPGQLSNAFFVDSPGGCGKTYLFNLLLTAVRADGDMALAVASSGIAALLLEGGTTAHSRFKIPINLEDTSTCHMKMGQDNTKVVQQAALIVWDEAPMTKRQAYEALDRSLRDIMRAVDPALEHVPFGGKVVLLAGDFRQVLPVLPRGTRAGIVGVSLKRSYLWHKLTVMKLRINMRVQMLLQQPGLGLDATAQQKWADYLLEVGDGTAGTPVVLPEELAARTDNPADLATAVFGDLSNISREALTGHALLTPKNDGVDELNALVTSRFPGEAHEFYSADSVDKEDDAALYPTEFLNSLQPQGMPAHKLVLKVGMPIMLLRNMNARLGLANGTRLIVKSMSMRVLQCEVLTGKHQGTQVLIPRIPLRPSDTDLPFTFQRLQFPIRPAFAMTINKSQGQTFKRVGVYLPQPVFGHGQLYVAMSRVGQPGGVTIMVKGGRWEDGRVETANVVFSEVFA